MWFLYVYIQINMNVPMNIYNWHHLCKYIVIYWCIFISASTSIYTSSVPIRTYSLVCPSNCMRLLTTSLQLSIFLARSGIYASCDWVGAVWLAWLMNFEQKSHVLLDPLIIGVALTPQSSFFWHRDQRHAWWHCSVTWIWAAVVSRAPLWPWSICIMSKS